MLTSRLTRVRLTRDRVIPIYINAEDPAWQLVAERLLDLFRGQEGRTHGEIDQDIADSFGSDPSQLVHQGLAKLLEDRCEFETVAGLPPEQLREAVFRTATLWRRGGAAKGRGGEGATWQRADSGTAATPSGPSPAHLASGSLPPLLVSPRRTGAASLFDRMAVLKTVARELSLTPEQVDQGMFADLKSEQRLVRFKDMTARQLLDRYNVALAQSVLLRATRVKVEIHSETPVRVRQLFRLLKFHRLVCEASQPSRGLLVLSLDGPLSLFSATQKYGLQLALFLPAILRCSSFEMRADLLWGPERKPKKFTLSAMEGLVSQSPDTGVYVPPELAMFVELFRKKITDWEICEETEVFPLGQGSSAGFWVPDFRLVHRISGKTVLLEVLGFWRRASAERHLQRLRQFAALPFILAVSDQLHIEEAELENLSAGIHRFRQMPLPDEIVKLANESLSA